MTTPGRSLDDAKLRRAYKLAQEFVGDTALDVPDQTHKTGENDQLAFMLEKIAFCLDALLVVTAPIPSFQLFPQFIGQDVNIPVGYDAITAARGVDTGYTVDVATGSRAHFIGDNPDITSVSAKNKTVIVEGDPNSHNLNKDKAGLAVRHTGGVVTITVPLSATEGWEVGDTIVFYNEGGGSITFAKGDPTINFTGGSDILPNNGTCGAIVMTAVDNWNFVGGFI